MKKIVLISSLLLILCSCGRENNSPLERKKVKSKPIQEITLSEITAPFIDMLQLMQNRNAKITSSQFDMGGWHHIFDRDSNTLARTACVNPAEILIEMDSGFELKGFSCQTECSPHTIQVLSANTLKDIKDVSGSCVEIFYKTNIPYAMPVNFNISSPVKSKFLKFLVLREEEDNFVHITSLDLFGETGKTGNMKKKTVRNSNPIFIDELAEQGLISVTHTPAKFGIGRWQDIFDMDYDSMAVAPDMSNVTVIVKFKPWVSIDRVRYKLNAGPNNMKIFVADSLKDIYSKSGNCTKILDIKNVPDAVVWADDVANIVTGHYLRIEVDRIGGGNAHVTEVDFYGMVEDMSSQAEEDNLDEF